VLALGDAGQAPLLPAPTQSAAATES
jgi:hypothetical protein